MKRVLASAVLAMCLVGVGACDDSDGDNAREQIEDAIGDATARGAGEAMRVALEAEDLSDGETLRDVNVLQENADDVPGDPTVSGITDNDGDGKDDDGMVELKVGDQSSCVTVTEQNDVSVDNGACAPTSS